MKIQEPVRINLGDQRLVTTERNSANSASFQKIMNSYSKELTQDHLHQLLQDIDKQGVQLSEKPTFNELRKYKNLVKQFMGEVTKNGMGLYQTESWDPYGGNKTLKTVQVLDKKLMELTDHVLNQQNAGLSILERIGEIKGLLINLYT
ncbi:YaaR family protein [Neobacillus sp.]|uniref:YaaR family protein n=1 Tax=Neobacillus sp. TaxID=2675273 RepID=UPI00289DF2AC|nr:YaaR family protein [Neobacillus sp.]